MLGEESALFRRQELKALVGIHAEPQQDGSGGVPGLVVGGEGHMWPGAHVVGLGLGWVHAYGYCRLSFQRLLCKCDIHCSVVAQAAEAPAAAAC